MATSTQNRATRTAAAGTVENLERERTFDLFRQWGYLEAELNPLGLLPPKPHPDLQIDNEWAQEARRIYCGSVGAEFMHIADPVRRRWIQEHLEGEPEHVEHELALDLLGFRQFRCLRHLGKNSITTGWGANYKLTLILHCWSGRPIRRADVGTRSARLFVLGNEYLLLHDGSANP